MTELEDWLDNKAGKVLKSAYEIEKQHHNERQALRDEISALERGRDCLIKRYDELEARYNDSVKNFISVTQDLEFSLKEKDKVIADLHAEINKMEATHQELMVEYRKVTSQPYP